MLAKFTYTICHLPGQKNCLADSLFWICKPVSEVGELTMIYISKVKTVENYEKFYADVINYLKSSNPLSTITEAEIVKFK